MLCSVETTVGAATAGCGLSFCLSSCWDGGATAKTAAETRAGAETKTVAAAAATTAAVTTTAAAEQATHPEGAGEESPAFFRPNRGQAVNSRWPPAPCRPPPGPEGPQSAPLQSQKRSRRPGR